MSDQKTQMSLLDRMRYLAHALKSGPSPGGQTMQSQMPTQMRGYQLYAKEAQINGEQPMSYEQWARSQGIR